jgi:hypothetical protein
VPAGEIEDLLAGHARDVPVRYSAVPDSRLSCKQVPDLSLICRLPEIFVLI